MLKPKFQYFDHLIWRNDWKRPWFWERLKVGEEDDRGWYGWMASPTQRIWVWVSSGSWWWTGKPGVKQSMGSQRVGHNWATEVKWSEVNSESTPWIYYTSSHYCPTVFTPGPRTRQPGIIPIHPSLQKLFKVANYVYPALPVPSCGYYNKDSWQHSTLASCLLLNLGNSPCDLV